MESRVNRVTDVDVRASVGASSQNYTVILLSIDETEEYQFQQTTAILNE